MLLLDDLPPLITNDRDIERYIDAFKRWNADDSKDVTPVFPRNILVFVDLFFDNLYLLIKKQINSI